MGQLQGHCEQVRTREVFTCVIAVLLVFLCFFSTKSPASPSSVLTALQDVSSESLYTFISVLSGEQALPFPADTSHLTTRFSYADGSVRAHRYIQRKLSEWGVPSFSDSFIGQSFRDVWVAGGSSLVAVGDGGRIFVGLEEGADWVRADAPTNETLTSISFVDSLVGFVVGRKGVILKSCDGGYTWQEKASPVESDLNSLTCASDTVVWAAGNFGYVIHSSDAGDTWSVVDRWTVINMYDVEFPAPDTGYLAADGGMVFRTVDGGESWQPKKPPSASKLLAIEFTDARRGWVVETGGRVFKTGDAGETWDLVYEDPDHLGLFAVSFFDSLHGFGCGSRQLVLYTEDGGLTWSRKQGNSRSSFFSVRAVGEARAWLAGPQVIASTEDGGTSFTFGPEHFPEHWTNLIGEVEGRKSPGQVFILGAHFDSISDYPFYHAPGADDNASGVAAVMEVARILSGREPEKTVRFAFFSGEEQGLVGSDHYARTVAADADTVIGCLILDMVGWGGTALKIYARQAGDSLAEKAQEVAAAYVPDLGVAVIVDSLMRYSDHASFWGQGMSSILAIERDWTSNPFRHSSQDKVEQLDLPLEQLAAQFAGALTLEMAGLLEVGISVCLCDPQVSQEGDAVLISWEECPRYSGGAMLERSTSGGTYVPIANLAMSLSEPASYRDRAVTPGESYRYRLRVEGPEGTCYSNSRSTGVSPGRAFLLSHLSFFPNPSFGELSISWFQSSRVDVVINLHDVQGRHLSRLLLPDRPAGVNRFHSDDLVGERLPCGVYFVSLSARGYLFTKKLVVLR